MNKENQYTPTSKEKKKHYPRTPQHNGIKDFAKNSRSPGKTLFGNVEYENQDKERLTTLLNRKLGNAELSYRPGPGGSKLAYIESCKAIELANQAFGYNGWSCRVLSCVEEYRHKNDKDRWCVGYSALVRIQLKDGVHHEDVGFGQSDGQKDLGMAIDISRKACVSDARKRALRLFGEYLGNSCYDRLHLKDVRSGKVVKDEPSSMNIPAFPGNKRVIENNMPFPAKHSKSFHPPNPPKASSDPLPPPKNPDLSLQPCDSAILNNASTTSIISSKPCTSSNKRKEIPRLVNANTSSESVNAYYEEFGDLTLSQLSYEP